ncbi:MAG: hypothetical protein U9Q33_03445 [Campylobacterota bacterium]|nr:hypothetical protein [Campylobacterota bacterium]
MVSITHTDPKYDTYQANIDYLRLLEIKKFIFLNIDSLQISIPLEKKMINDSDDFDLITPINFQESTGNFIKENLQSIYEVLKTTNAVCFYIQTKDEINYNNEMIDSKRYRTNYYFNLLLSKEEIYSNKKRDARQRLRKALKNIKVNITEDIVSEEFYQNYARISEENDFSEKYKFSLEQFNGFSSIKGIKYLELRSEGDFVAGGFFGLNHKEIDYLYAAGSERFRDNIRLLLWIAIEYFKDKGYEKLFLGGGIKEDDSLAEFKSRMGTYYQKCYTIMSILDKEKAQKYAKKEVTKEWFNNFFPPYRDVMR